MAEAKVDIDFTNINKNFIQAKEGDSKTNSSLLKSGWIQGARLDRINSLFVLGTYHLPRHISLMEKKEIAKELQDRWPKLRYTLAQEVSTSERHHLHILFKFNTRPNIKLAYGKFQKLLIKVGEVELGGTFHTISKGKIANVHNYVTKEDNEFIRTLTNEDLSVVVKPPSYIEIAKTGDIRKTIASLEEANLKRSIHASVFSVTMGLANMVQLKKIMAKKKNKYSSNISEEIFRWNGHTTLFIRWEFTDLHKNDEHFADLYRALSIKFDHILLISALDDLIIQQQHKQVDLLLIDYPVFKLNRALANNQVYVSAHTRNCQTYVPSSLPRVIFYRETETETETLVPNESWVPLYKSVNAKPGKIDRTGKKKSSKPKKSVPFVTPIGVGSSLNGVYKFLKIRKSTISGKSVTPATKRFYYPCSEIKTKQIIDDGLGFDQLVDQSIDRHGKQSYKGDIYQQIKENLNITNLNYLNFEPKGDPCYYFKEYKIDEMISEFHQS